GQHPIGKACGCATPLAVHDGWALIAEFEFSAARHDTGIESADRIPAARQCPAAAVENGIGLIEGGHAVGISRSLVRHQQPGQILRIACCFVCLLARHGRLEREGCYLPSPSLGRLTNARYWASRSMAPSAAAVRPSAAIRSIACRESGQTPSRRRAVGG